MLGWPQNVRRSQPPNLDVLLFFFFTALPLPLLGDYECSEFSS